MPPNTVRRGWLLFLALIPFAVLTAYHWDWGAPLGFGDHAQYLAHARALVEGKAYTDIGYIYHPQAPMLGPRAYPPGLPVTLAPLVAIGGVDSWLIRAFMVVTLVLFAYLAYRRLAMAMAPWQAALAAGWALLAIELDFGSIVPLSDPGLCVFLWGALLAVDSASSPNVWTWRRVALVTALGFAAIAYRVPGIVVIPALTLHALLTWREHRGRALVPVLIWVTVGLAVLASARVALPFGAYLIPRPEHLVERLTNALRAYRAAVFELELYPFPTDALNDAYHLIASIALVAGAAALLWRYRRSMLTAVVVTYLVLLTFAPTFDGRYLWPLYPVLAAGITLGFTAAWRGLTRALKWRPNPAPVALALALVMLASLWHGLRVKQSPSLDRLAAAQSLFAWLRERHARQPMRAVFHNPRVLTLKTRVPAMGAILAKPGDQLRSLREREITHFVWQRMENNPCRARLLNLLPREFPGFFTLEYENANFRVYRLNATDSIPSDSWQGRELTPQLCRALPPS